MPGDAREGATLAEVEALRTKSLAERTPLQEALEVIGEAASALEHEHPERWTANGIARLRQAAETLRGHAEDRLLLDVLADSCDDRDVLFRRSKHPDEWAANPGDHDVVEIRQWGEDEHETARGGLRRLVAEQGSDETKAELARIRGGRHAR